MLQVPLHEELEFKCSLSQPTSIAMNRLHIVEGMRQLLPMGLFWQFLGRVLAFTLRGSVRQADSWQIIAGGTALPSLGLGVVYGLLGQEMPTIEQAEWASYFGYGLVTWLAFRFLVAPFFIWREEHDQVLTLREELTRPEKLVLERLAKHRAKARARLSAELESAQSSAYAEEWSGALMTSFSMRMARIRRLQAQAGLSRAFEEARLQFVLAVKTEAETPNGPWVADTNSMILLRLMQRYLMGEITGEDLALQLPKDTGSERQQ